MKMKPAEYVIFMIGGVRETARVLDRHPSGVGKWLKSTLEQGTGGEIPRSAHKDILKFAKRRNLDIGPSDLIFGRDL